MAPARPLPTMPAASIAAPVARPVASGSIARVTSAATPITTTFATVPIPGRCRSGIHASSTRAPTAIDDLPERESRRGASRPRGRRPTGRGPGLRGPSAPSSRRRATGPRTAGRAGASSGPCRVPGDRRGRERGAGRRVGRLTTVATMPHTARAGEEGAQDHPPTVRLIGLRFPWPILPKWPHGRCLLPLRPSPRHDARPVRARLGPRLPPAGRPDPHAP